MPLQKAHITIPLGGGLATAVDDKLLPIGKSIEMENCRQGRLGEVVPRFDTQALSTNILGNASTIPPPWAMSTFKGSLVSLSQIGDYPLAMWSPTANQWISGGQSSTSSLAGQTDIRTARRGPIFARGDRITGEGTAPDIAYLNGYYFVIYQYQPPGTATPNVYERILDAATGKVVAERIQSPGAVGYLTGVRATNNQAVFCYSDAATTGFVFDVWQISNLDAGPTTYTAPGLGTGIAIRTAFDMVVKDSTTVTVAYYHVGTNAIRGLDLTVTTGAQVVWVLNDATAATVPLGSWNWVKDLGGSGKLALATYSAAQGVRVQWNIPTAGATRQAASTIVIDAAPGVVSNIVAATYGSTAGGSMIVLYDNIVLATPTSLTKMAVTDTGVPFGFIQTLRSVTLRSKIWKQGADFYVVTEMPSATQNTRFVHRLDWFGVLAPNQSVMPPVAKAQLNNGVLLSTSSGSVSDVVTSSSGTWVSANTTTTRLSGQPSAYGATFSGIELLSVAYKSQPDTSTGTPREAIDSMFVPGGMLGAFDGVSYVSDDFAAYPERLQLSTAAGAGFLSAGTYYYKATYVRPDASGRYWRSAPSAVQGIGGVVLNGHNTIVVPTLRVVDTLATNVNGIDGYYVELWRGDVNDNSTFKLVGVQPNNISVDSVTFTDGLADTTIDANEFLYTNGSGVLPNDAHPGFTSICVAGNRLWGAYKNELWMSNQFVPGRGLLWAEQNKIILNDQHGDITAIAAQPNGVVVVFKADAVYGVAGDGPDQAGRGGFQVQFVAISMGTTNPRSIVETSIGTEFLSTGSRHGWYRIGLGLTPEYIGGAVERYTGSTIVGAIVLPSSNETRYYLATGGCLVHDYTTDLWGVYTGTAATCATAWGSFGVYATATPNIVTDTASITGTDWSGSFTMKVTTPWIKLADLKGFERFYRVTGVGELGDDVGDGRTAIAMYVNLDSSAPLITKSAAIGHLWDWELRYSGKFDSAKFVISSLVANEDHPASVKWTAIVIEYGTHSNVRHRPSGNRAI